MYPNKHRQRLRAVQDIRTWQDNVQVCTTELIFRFVGKLMVRRHTQ